MARDPGSVWAPLPEAGAPDGYVKTQFIVHSTGDNGTAKATARYFGGVTPSESTFIIGQGPHDPTLQIVDSTDRADANMSASIRAISVEVVGDGVGGYNAWQRSELIRLGLWARSVHPGILPRIIPSHTEAGCGWHVMFGAPGPWAGVAKVCPGKQRIKELQNDIFPAIFTGTPTSEEDDMTPEQDQMLRMIARRLRGPDNQPNDMLQRIDAALHGNMPLGPDGQVLNHFHWAEANQAARHASTLEAVRQLGEMSPGQSIDLAAIEEAGRRGAAKALEELTITVATAPTSDPAAS